MSDAPSRRRFTRGLHRAGQYGLLSAVALVFLAPFIWMASGSLKRDSEFLSYPPSLFGESLRWDNYARVFELQPFAQQFANSVIVMASVGAITVVLTTMAGYAFARVRFPGRSALFLLLLSALFIPVETTILPLYRLVSSLGWIDTLTPLIIITPFTTTGPICIFIMRQAFLGLPYELAHAARIDGAGRWRIFLQIYVPLVRPSIASVVIYSSWISWNQFLEPLLFLRSQEHLTIPVALPQYFDLQGPLWGAQAAAATLSVLPVIVVFLFAQRQVVSGLAEGSLK